MFLFTLTLRFLDLFGIIFTSDKQFMSPFRLVLLLSFHLCVLAALSRVT